MQFRKLSILLLLLCATIGSNAQQPDSTGFVGMLTGLADVVLNALTIKAPKFQNAIYPAASYSGRQGFAIGIMDMLEIKHNQRPASIVTLSALFSTKKMYEFQSKFEVFPHKNGHIEGKLEYLYLPDELYAVGNAWQKKPLSPMELRSLFASLKYHYSFGAIHIGPYIEYADYRYQKLDSGFCLPDSRNIAAGLAIRYEARDNVLYPSSGGMTELSYLQYKNFCKLTLDARKFFPIRNNVLGLQFYAAGSTGNAPYGHLQSFAGSQLARAVKHEQKYQDRLAWLARTEWRQDIFWRIGYVAFAGVGNVAHNFNKQLWQQMHLMGGAGLRFKVFPNSGFNARLDFAISQHGDKAFYLNFREVF